MSLVHRPAGAAHRTSPRSADRKGSPPVTSTLTPFASVADLPWVPVRALDGQRTRVGLREVLTRAHELAGYDTDSAVELSTLNRFLPAVVALVVREMGGRIGEARLDPVAVDAVLDRHAHALHLRHPETPFAQEWHYAPESRPAATSPLPTLRFESPGASSKVWKDRGALASRWMPQMDLGVIALHVLCHWFHSVGGNSRSLYPGMVAVSGSIGSRVGNDLALFWRGRTLADTLLANTPKAWVHGEGLPAFLDRTGTTRGPVEALHPLWAMTYAPNAVLLEWDEDQPTSYRPGGSRWGLTDIRTATEGADTKAETGARFQARKDALSELKRQDPARIWTVKTKTDGTTSAELYTRLTAEQAPLVRLREWYQANGGAALTHSPRRLESVKVPDLVTGDWALEFYGAKVEMRSMAPTVVDATWFACDPAELDLADERADLILSVARDADTLATEARRTLAASGGPLDHVAPAVKWGLCDDLVARFYALADDTCRTVITDATAGRDVRQELRDDLARCAVRAFDEATDLFMTGTGVAVVIRARQTFARKARATVRPTTPTTEEAA